MSYQKSKDWKERWYRLRNYQSKDFWAMVFARPLTILMLLPVADLDWVTSNRITIFSVITKLFGTWMLIYCPSYSGGIIGGALTKARSNLGADPGAGRSYLTSGRATPSALFSNSAVSS